MKIFKGIDAFHRPPRRAVVTIGMFDGVHLAHQRLIRMTVRLARQRRGTSVALTFDPDPQRVLAPSRALPPLMPLAQRLELMRAFGLDVVWIIPFTRRFAQCTPEAFVRTIVLDRLRAACVVVGTGFAFGNARRGDVALMTRVGRPHGLRVVALPQVRRAGVPVSSSRIRGLVQAGRVEVARALLGRPSRLSGRVVRGRGVGRRMGFPTANVHLDPMLRPASGVYAVCLWKETATAVRWRGLMNLGHRPTFGRGPLACEVHLPDFRGRLYGQRVRIGLLHRLRDERRFASPEALAQQIRRDLATLRVPSSEL